MHGIASMDRTSGYVRTLVREQLRVKRQSSQGALERLYERMKDRGEEIDIDQPKISRARLANTAEHSSSEEDEDDDDSDAGAGDTIPRLSHGKEGTKSAGSVLRNKGSAQREYLRTSTGFLYSPRRSSPVRPPSASKDEHAANQEGVKKERVTYTLRSANIHSEIMNRRLSLAESVKKNYSKYIRTPEPESLDDKRTDSESSSRALNAAGRSKTTVTPSIVAVMEENQPETQVSQDSSFLCTSPPESGKVDNLSLQTFGVSRMNPPESGKVDNLSLPTFGVSRMNRSSSTLALITTVEEDMPLEVLRSNSALALPSFVSLPATTPDRSQTQRNLRSPAMSRNKSPLTSTDVHVQRLRKGKMKIEGRFRQRTNDDRKNRTEVMKELRKAHSHMDERMKEVRTKKAMANLQAYKREQMIRADKMAVFQREMDDIMKRLKDINNRLDTRLKILEREEALAKMELEASP